MGTTQILWELLLHIQGERNPIYRRDVRRGTTRGIGCVPVVVAYLVLIVVLIISNRSSIYLVGNVIVPGELVIWGIPTILSLLWTLPIALRASEKIAHERSAQTFQLLLLTPFPPETVLLAKAASGIRNIWNLAIGVIGIASLFRVAAIVFYGLSTSSEDALVLGIISLLLVLIEPVQEMALAIVIGMAAGLVTDSSRIGTLVAFAGGTLVRFVQIFSTLFMVPILNAQINTLSTAALGSMSLLVAAPGVASLLYIVVLIALREGLIRVLFGWTVEQLREGHAI